MIKIYDTDKEQYYLFEDYLQSLENDDLYGNVRDISITE